MQGRDPKFTALLEFIRDSRGVDFSGYKEPNLMRRTLRRMQMVGITEFDAYLDYLAHRPEEFGELFDSILINVTDFFRDGAAWRTLAQDFLPGLLERKSSGEPIRVWSAGCASGEEAYSIAILLAETMGAEAFQDRVKVYATDIDDDALRQARQGSYPASRLASVSPECRARYFAPNGDRFTFRADLRRAIIFGNHNLLQDAPIPRLDLLVCRNTIMYFNTESQGKLLVRFRFALNDSGLLFLGRAELLLSHAALFTPVSGKHRIFAKATATPSRSRSFAPRPANAFPAPSLHDLAFRQSPVAQLILDTNGCLESANDRARTLADLADHEIGRPLQDLAFFARMAEIRLVLDQVRCEQKPVTLPVVEQRFSDGQEQFLEVQVLPLRDVTGMMQGITVILDDVTLPRRLERDLRCAVQELKTVREVLQAGEQPKRPQPRDAWAQQPHVSAACAGGEDGGREGSVMSDRSAMTSPQAIVEAATSFMQSRVLLTAAELGVFAALEPRGATSVEVARHLGTAERATDRLLNALVPLGLVSKQASIFFNTPASSRFLVAGRPEFLAGLGHFAHLFETWSGLTSAVRTGRPPSTATVKERDTVWLAAFIAAMHWRARQHAPLLIPMLDLEGVERVLDVGGGSGAYAAAFARAGLEGVVFDLPDVLPLTRGFLAEEGMLDRVGLIAGDYERDDLGQEFDLVLLSQILHSHAPDANQKLLAKAAAALRSGGQVVVQEFIMDENRTGPPFNTLFALNMLVNTPAGDTYTVREVQEWMEAAGLGGVQCRDTSFGTTILTGRLAGKR